MLNNLIMSDYFKAIDKNGVERESALDLKEYTLFIDKELCPRVQEIRKIVNPNNDINNVLMDTEKVFVLEDGVEFYYKKKKNTGVYKVCSPKYDGTGVVRQFYGLPLVPPNEVTDSKMYWEDEVKEVI